METIVVITAITFTFGMPVLIIFIIFHFRHKKRAAKYRLAEQMMASGQPLPKNFLEEEKPKDMRTKGISNVFLGIGLFILLWAITGEFGIGCVGLFIMLIGAGQLVIHHTQEKKEQNPSVPTPYEHRGEEEDARIDGFEITGHPANEE